MDPIEKKPLYHYYPGSSILSVAPNSCNLKCPYCQNADISQKDTTTTFIEPEELIKIAIQRKSFGISYTYTEPLTWYEYLIDTAKIAHKKGLKNVLVTNGMINEEPLRNLIPYIDAANIDLKSIEEKFYSQIVKGKLSCVINTIKIVKNYWHIEITNLIIPGYNDSPSSILQLIEFISFLDPKIPLHFTRYFPRYKFNAPATPIATLKWVFKEGIKKLKYVYIGNVDIEEGQNTYCPQCNNLLVRRNYFETEVVGIKKKKCTKCGGKVDFIL
jgi:pyruvate formate lyase activating enzyme